MTTEKRGRSGNRVVEKVAQKVNAKVDHLDRVVEKVNAKADHLDRVAEKVARKADRLERISSGLGTFDVWARAEPSARRPRFTREEIASSAMRIADTEGFEALSMRRLATELGAGTMTLYHYVRTKDELLTLVCDEVMGEIVLAPGEMPENWRDALTAIAMKTRAACIRHPWIMDITDDRALGPNAVRHFDQTLQAVASLPLSLADRFDICSVVDEYVFGCALSERDRRHGGEHNAEMISYVNRLVETGDYPQLAAMADELGLDEAWRQIEAHHNDPDRFARNLRRLLDGIEADLPASGH
jgi:AcrR family transcriptional regulator